jgi:hypothetical protein
MIMKNMRVVPIISNDTDFIGTFSDHTFSSSPPSVVAQTPRPSWALRRPHDSPLVHIAANGAPRIGNLPLFIREFGSQVGELQSNLLRVRDFGGEALLTYFL